MVARLKGLLRLEDLALLAWVMFVAPLLGSRELVSPDLGDTAAPLRGLWAVGAGLGALAMLAFRPPGDDLWDAVTQARAGGVLAAARQNALAWSSFIVLVAIGIVLDGGLADLGINAGEDLLFGIIIVGALLMFASRRLPTVPTGVRRLLVTPFVLSAGGFFDETVGGLFDSLDPGGMLAAAPDAAGVALVIALIVLASAPFYALLVFSPRMLADREGSLVAWLIRYAVFLVGSVAGIDWLLALGR